MSTPEKVRLREANRILDEETIKIRENPWISILPLREAATEQREALTEYVASLRTPQRLRLDRASSALEQASQPTPALLLEYDAALADYLEPQ